MNKGISLIIVILVFVGVIYAQETFFGDGKEFKKRIQQTNEPKVVIDTVRLQGERTVYKLSSSFSRQFHNVSATSGNNLWIQVTPILGDTTETVYYHGVFIYETGDSLVIKSSGGANDSGKVSLLIYTR